ncbi:hypothetical protein, partial [Lentilactobacillus hilgardii]|uniref:hypothetical protein n=1 Tax=Lentilactobacillus hilgardii TaxID=1588 RepID=UPI0021A91994
VGSESNEQLENITQHPNSEAGQYLNTFLIIRGGGFMMVDNIWLKWFFVLFYLVMGTLLYTGQSMVVMYMMVIGMFLEALYGLVESYIKRKQ